MMRVIGILCCPRWRSKSHCRVLLRRGIIRLVHLRALLLLLDLLLLQRTLLKLWLRHGWLLRLLLL